MRGKSAKTATVVLIPALIILCLMNLCLIVMCLIRYADIKSDYSLSANGTFESPSRYPDINAAGILTDGEKPAYRSSGAVTYVAGNVAENVREVANYSGYLATNFSGYVAPNTNHVSGDIHMFAVLEGLSVYRKNLKSAEDAPATQPNTETNPDIEPDTEIKPDTRAASGTDDKSGLNENTDKPSDHYDFSKLVKSSVIYADVTKDSKIYKKGSKKSAVIGNIKKGGKVEILEDTDCKWYKIRVAEKLTGWVPAEVLAIPPDPPTNKTTLTTDQLEKYVEIKGLTSPTKYLIWVDIDRQRTYVFYKNEGKWKLLKNFICSTGRNISPTRRGIFKIQDRGNWFYSARYGSGAKYWIRFSDGYLFHSVAMDKKGNVIDDTLGKRASHGCVRHSIEDSLWLYKNIPANTTVFID